MICAYWGGVRDKSRKRQVVSNVRVVHSAGGGAAK